MGKDVTMWLLAADILMDSIFSCQQLTLYGVVTYITQIIDLNAHLNTFKKNLVCKFLLLNIKKMQKIWLNKKGGRERFQLFSCLSGSKAEIKQ